MSSSSSTTTTTANPSDPFHPLRLKPCRVGSDDVKSDLPSLKDEHRVVLESESWRRQPIDFTDLIRRIHTEYNPLLHEKEYAACAEKLIGEIELFGKSFERYTGGGASQSTQKEKGQPSSNKNDSQGSTSSKGKSASLIVEPEYQFQSMMAMGIPKDEIHQFTEPTYWLKYHDNQIFKELKEKSDRFGSWFESKWHELDSRLRVYEYDVKKLIAEIKAEKARNGDITMRRRSRLVEKEEEIKVCEVETTALQYLLKRQRIAIEALLTETDGYVSRECRRRYNSAITPRIRNSSISGSPWQCRTLESFHTRYNKMHTDLASAAPLTKPEEVAAFKAYEAEERQRKERRMLRRREMKAARMASKDGGSSQRTRGWNEYDDGEFADVNGSMSASPFDSRAPSISENGSNPAATSAAGLDHDSEETLSKFILQSCVAAGSALVVALKKPFAANKQSVRISRASTLRSGNTTRQGSPDTLHEHESEGQGLLSGRTGVNGQVSDDGSRPVSREMKYQTFAQPHQPKQTKSFMEVFFPCL